jgi:hypothetical protein
VLRRARTAARAEDVCQAFARLRARQHETVKASIPSMAHLKGSIPSHATLERLLAGPRSDRIYLNTTCQTLPPRPMHLSSHHRAAVRLTIVRWSFLRQGETIHNTNKYMYYIKNVLYPIQEMPPYCLDNTYSVSVTSIVSLPPHRRPRRTHKQTGCTQGSTTQTTLHRWGAAARLPLLQEGGWSPRPASRGVPCDAGVLQVLNPCGRRSATGAASGRKSAPSA